MSHVGTWWAREKYKGFSMTFWEKNESQGFGIGVFVKSTCTYVDSCS